VNALNVDGPLRAAAGLAELEVLWKQLHEHHRRVASYGPLVADLEASWRERRSWYERLLGEGGSYFLARRPGGPAIGYALVQIVLGRDDTFEVTGGICELVSLVVIPEERGSGVGRALMEAARALALENGVDTMKVAVMAGNDSAQDFYESWGFRLGEHVLYKPLG
jgi:ribosomal protein S18 acetylase RimI-like enzyme